jgi:hypothetical protein
VIASISSVKGTHTGNGGVFYASESPNLVTTTPNCKPLSGNFNSSTGVLTLFWNN